jgi:RHS repeat-associated protein
MRTIFSVLVGVVLLAPEATMAQTEQVTYYYTDAIGSVRMTTDGAGGSVTRYDYLPFGEPWPSAGPDVRQFAGKERDSESGLNYFGARYYANQTARFTTVDPVLDRAAASADPQQWNRYAYVRNNPLRFVDPDGREIWSPFQSARPSDFAPAAGFLAGVAKELANFVIGLNSPGHMRPDLETDRFYKPESTSEALGMVVTDVGALAVQARSGPQGAGVQANRAAGNAFRDELATTLRNAGRDVQTEVYKKTVFGARYIDIEVSTKEGAVLGGIETKTGGSRYTPSQRAKDRYLKDVQNYPVNVVRKPEDP